MGKPTVGASRGDDLRLFSQVARCCLTAMVLPVLAGCIGTQVRFYTVVKKTQDIPDGWQEACLEALIQNMTTKDSHVCAVGVGMPIENKQNGYITSWEAGEIAADCINMAAERAIQPASADNPSALVCLNFKNTLFQILRERVEVHESIRDADRAFRLRE
jgi:hypothetical protein